MSFKSLDDIAAFIAKENAIMCSKIAKVQEDLSKQINNLNLQFNAKLDVLSKENVILKAGLSELEDRFTRQERNDSIIIRGVPMLQNEDLQTILSNIASAINFNMVKCLGVNLYRTVNKSTNKSSMEPVRVLRSTSATSQSKAINPPVIVVQFLAKWDRFSFLHQYLLYLKSGNLNVSHLGIGLSSTSRIYVGENLTKRNAIILNRCAVLKSSGKINQYFTKNGLVHLRRVKDGTAEVISSEHTLNSIVFTLEHSSISTSSTI